MTVDKPIQLDAEATGDWCGFKGASYHLTFAVWMLLTQRASEISFYAGNDLQAQPVVPSGVLGSDGWGMYSQQDLTDEWIQVKAHAGTWTRGSLIEDNLLGTFLLNALLSIHRGRSWNVSLATTSPINVSDVLAFIAAPSDFPHLKEKFDSVIAAVQRDWREYLERVGPETDVPSLSELSQSASAILNQLTKSEPRSHELLTIEIELELTRLFHDQTTAREKAAALSGSVLQAIAKADEPFPISLTWLERQIGTSLRANDLFSLNPVAACNAQIQRTQPASWSQTASIPRPHVQEVFGEFLEDDRSLFVLVGESGAGKSWSCAHFAVNTLRDRMRIWLSADHLFKKQSLVTAVADACRPLARPNISDQELWRLLIGASEAAGRGPLIIFADDLYPSPNPVERSAALSNYCREATASGAKLVLATRPHIWRRIWEAQLETALFRRFASRLDDSDTRVPASYHLGALSYDEIAEIISRRVPEKLVSKHMRTTFRDPRNAALRNPYIMSVFLNRWDPAAADHRYLIDIDTLLDAEMSRRWINVGRSANCEPAELAAVKKSLVPALWVGRKTGVSTAELVRTLDATAPQLGRVLLDALQNEDVLTRGDDPRSQGVSLTFANPQQGDRLYAIWLAERLTRGDDVLAELSPGIDDGVVVALLRCVPTPVIVDPISWGDSLIRRDPEWLSAVAEGLCQRAAVPELRLLSHLIAWANDQGGVARWNAMRALGGMTGRSSRARRWAAFLYSDEHHHLRRLGAIALSRAIEVAPRWVERRMQLRVRRDVVRQPQFGNKDETRAAFLRSALEPLRQIESAEAAKVARSILKWLARHYSPTQRRPGLSVLETIDESLGQIRGRAAVYGPREERDDILRELATGDEEVRLHAARSLVPVAEERPDVARAVIFARLQVEPKRLVILHLLRALYAYVGSDGDDVLAACANRSLHSRVSSKGTLLTLVSAARGSTHARSGARPAQRARAILASLRWTHPEQRALDKECLAFAFWKRVWRVEGESVQSDLRCLSSIDYTGISNRLRMFEARGASVATLLLMATEISPLANDLSESQTFYYPLALETGWDFGFVRLRPSANASRLMTGHGLLPQLHAQLVECLSEYHANEAHPIDTLECGWQTAIAAECADLLAASLLHAPAPGATLASVRDDWPLLRIGHGLIEGGCRDEGLVLRLKNLCLARANEWSSVSTYRDRVVATLAKHGLLDPLQAIKAGSGAPFAFSSEVHQLDTVIAQDPTGVCEVLHRVVRRDNAVPILWGWACESSIWQSVLLGHVYRVCMRDDPLSLADCQELIEEMSVATEDGGCNGMSEQTRQVFDQLAHFASAAPVHTLQGEFGSDFLSVSQKDAIDLATACSDVEGVSLEWVYRFLSSHNRGWVEDTRHWIRDGQVVFGSGENSGCVYFPPALRIALAIAGQRYGLGDLGSRWAGQRAAVRRSLHFTRASPWVEQAIAQGALDDTMKAEVRDRLEVVRAAREATPHHMDLLECIGYHELVLGDLEAASTSLRECIESELSDSATRARARYNLACVYARCGNYAACDIQLRTAIKEGHGVAGKSLLVDPDFALVRQLEWFQRIVRQLTPPVSHPVMKGGLMRGSLSELRKALAFLTHGLLGWACRHKP
ncbi:MAG TPA: ATP-binding protein [Terriglobales bacterium]|nr:ATP-binding protein [Terriglobales bacterium]